MAITIESPAPFLAARALIDRAVGLKPLLARIATYQLLNSSTYGLVDESGRLLVVVGFVLLPDQPNTEEVFLIGETPDLVVSRLVELRRATRLILTSRRHSGIRRLVAHVKFGHEPGRRLARLAGFSCAVCDGAPSKLERWERPTWLNSRSPPPLR